MAGGWICEEDSGHHIVLEDLSPDVTQHNDRIPHSSSLSVKVTKLIGKPVCERCVEHNRDDSPSPFESSKRHDNRQPPFSLDLDDACPTDKYTPPRDDDQAMDDSNDDALIKKLLQITKECQQRNIDTNRLLNSHAALLEFQLQAKQSNGNESSDQVQTNNDMQSRETDMRLAQNGTELIPEHVPTFDSSFESVKAQRARIFAEKAEARMKQNNKCNNNDHDE